jgi:hypothetical protein
MRYRAFSERLHTWKPQFVGDSLIAIPSGVVCTRTHGGMRPEASPRASFLSLSIVKFVPREDVLEGLQSLAWLIRAFAPRITRTRTLTHRPCCYVGAVCRLKVETSGASVLLADSSEHETPKRSGKRSIECADSGVNTSIGRRHEYIQKRSQIQNVVRSITAERRRGGL